MGNLDMDNFCNCENNDSKFETSFKTNQNSDKLLCPFINTIIYQNYNIENGKKNKTNNPKKKKDLNFSKKQSKFDLDNVEMNFEYHTDKVSKLNDSNKPKNQSKSIFNLNPITNNDNEKYSLNNNNDLYNNNDDNNNNNNFINEINNINQNNNYIYENNNNNKNDINKIFTGNENENENENENSNKNIFINENNEEQNDKSQNDIEEDKANSNKNYKSNEITSNNSDNSNVKTNIEKPKKPIIKNGLDIQVWGKNSYYIGYFTDNLADGLGKFYTGNSKYSGEFKNDQANGYGIYHNNSDETIYEGYWLNNAQNDCGIEKWSDESIFIGEYLNGEKKIGTYLWKDGSRYEGEFNHNMFDGYGIYFYSKNKIYLGEWKNNKKHGYGEFIFYDKLFVGNYIMDQKDGFGISYWKNENKIYIGFWKNNKKVGFGKMFHENKKRFGLWGDENDNKKVQWFNSDEEAFDYIENNNLENYKKYFEYNIDEVIEQYSDCYKDEYISPCIIPDILTE